MSGPLSVEADTMDRMSRHGANPDRVLEAMLAGASLRHAREGSAVAEAIAELQEITTRGDLLSRAAGHQRASSQGDRHNSSLHARAAELLVAAGGTDEAIASAAMDAVLERMTHGAPSAPRPGVDC